MVVATRALALVLLVLSRFEQIGKGAYGMVGFGQNESVLTLSCLSDVSMLSAAMPTLWTSW